MTIVAMILSVVVGSASLAIGYSQMGLGDPARWFLVLGAAWLIAHWRKWYWFSSVGLLVTTAAAAYGVWREFPMVWMLLGALGGLLGWDLSDFARRLGFASPMDDTSTLERRHLERAGIVAGLGMGLALLSLVIRVNRLPFEVAVILVLLAVLGLTRLVMGLRRF